jgi:hypothetical protein
MAGERICMDVIKMKNWDIGETFNELKKLVIFSCHF